MDTADSQRLSRISQLLLAGAGVAFAWVLLSFTFGFTSGQAHADEDPGLLGSVTGVVDDTATGVTDVVDDAATGVTGGVQNTTTAVEQTAAPVVEPVVETVAPVVEAVEPIVPVAPVVEAVEPIIPVVDAVQSTVAPVVTTVTEIADGNVVAPLAETAVGVVTGVPVVGGVVTSLGVDRAATSLGSSVDGVLQGTTQAVSGTVTNVVDTTGGVVPTPVTPTLPGRDELLAGADEVAAGAFPQAAASTPAPPAGDLLSTLSRAAYLTGALALSSLVADAAVVSGASDVSFIAGGATEGLLTLLRAVLQADSALIGPGGAGPGAWVLVALGFVVAYRAWMRRSGLENDVAPAAPVLSTDVSPD